MQIHPLCYLEGVESARATTEKTTKKDAKCISYSRPCKDVMNCKLKKRKLQDFFDETQRAKKREREREKERKRERKKERKK